MEIEVTRAPARIRLVVLLFDAAHVRLNVGFGKATGLRSNRHHPDIVTETHIAAA
jgi:hypothetical protein